MRLVANRKHVTALVVVACAALATTLISQAPARRPAAPPILDDFTARLVAAANERPRLAVRYDPKYVRIRYPGGDVPADTGVCTDEIIRIYREVGIDLQKEVHEDMLANFRLYPRKFGLARPDANIDHRRVPNLRVFLARKGASLPVTEDPADYHPGDIVTWDLTPNPVGPTHIGIVVDRSFGPRYGIVHNIGAGPKLEDALFAWKVTGHYRYRGPAVASAMPAPPR
jgi:uncharacterized protein YijF (DUF1287 family)